MRQLSQMHIDDPGVLSPSRAKTFPREGRFCGWHTTTWINTRSTTARAGKQAPVDMFCLGQSALFLLFPPTEDVRKQVVIETQGNKKRGMGTWPVLGKAAKGVYYTKFRR